MKDSRKEDRKCLCASPQSPCTVEFHQNLIIRPHLLPLSEPPELNHHRIAEETLPITKMNALSPVHGRMAAHRLITFLGPSKCNHPHHQRRIIHLTLLSTPLYEQFEDTRCDYIKTKINYYKTQLASTHLLILLLLVYSVLPWAGLPDVAVRV